MHNWDNPLKHTSRQKLRSASPQHKLHNTELPGYSLRSCLCCTTMFATCATDANDAKLLAQVRKGHISQAQYDAMKNDMQSDSEAEEDSSADEEPVVTGMSVAAVTQAGLSDDDFLLQGSDDNTGILALKDARKIPIFSPIWSKTIPIPHHYLV